MDPVYLHERVFVSSDKTERVERIVDCPKGEVVALAKCERCEHFFELNRDERFGGAVVDCARAPLLDASHLSRHLDRTSDGVVTTVSEIMSHSFVAADPGLSAEVVRQYLVDKQIGCVLVLDAQRFPVGIATLRDFVERGDCAGQTASDIGSSPVVFVPQALPVSRASAIMAYEGIHHLAVVDSGGAASGILSALDVMRWMGHRAGMLIPRMTARQRRRSEAPGARTIEELS
jgi:CBS domain-containing protein